MRIYLDLIFILNWVMDLILLLGVSLLLRRNVKIKKLILASFIGGISILTLFLKINSLELFIIKVIISLFMVLIAFGFRNIKYTLRNLFYLYTSSMILGGFLYFLNVQFSYKQEGLIFYHNGLSINFIFLLIFSPIIIYTYVRQGLKLKNNYANYYKIDVYLKDGKKLNLTGFMDSGNKLVDPYKNRAIILIDEKTLNTEFKEEDIIYVPYETIDNQGFIRCVKIDKVVIIGVGIRRNVLVGIINQKINIDGVNCILHYKLLEG